jgi:hypothetical protein
MASVPVLDHLGLPHFIVLYRDHVFEWDIGRDMGEHYGTQPAALACDVSWQYVGQSESSVKDIIDFTVTYILSRGPYDLFTNNCFTFSRHLCDVLLRRH